MRNLVAMVMAVCAIGMFTCDRSDSSKSAVSLRKRYLVFFKPDYLTPVALFDTASKIVTKDQARTSVVDKIEKFIDDHGLQDPSIEILADAVTGFAVTADPLKLERALKSDPAVHSVMRVVRIEGRPIQLRHHLGTGT